MNFLYKEFRHNPSRTLLKSEMILAKKHIVTLSEPPVFDDHYGNPGLYRSFEMNGLPKGYELTLLLSDGLLNETLWASDGNCEIKKLKKVHFWNSLKIKNAG